MKEKKSVTLSYRVTKIHTFKFSVSEVDDDYFNLIFSEDSQLLNLDSSLNLNIDKEKSLINVDVKSTLQDLKKDISLVDHIGRTTFHVKGLMKTWDEKSNSFDLPNGLLIQIFSLSYSHARALLATEISPTMYKDKFILPVVNPQNFLKNQK